MGIQGKNSRVQGSSAGFSSTAQTDSSPTGLVFSRFSRPFGIAAAMVLAAAAALKLHQLTQTPGDTLLLGFLQERTAWFLLIQVELLAAFLLIAGWLPRLTWQATGLMFAAFSGVVLVKILNGETSCGCFGIVEIPPYLALAFDISFMAGFLILPPPQEALHVATSHDDTTSSASSSSSPTDKLPRTVTIVGLGYVAIAIFASYVLAFLAPATLGANGQIVGGSASDVVYLRPEHWQGSQLPIAQYIETNVDFMQGRWQLVFVRQGCEKCEEALPRYEEFARQQRELGSGLSVLVIDLNADKNRGLLDVDPSLSQAWMAGDKEWYMPTPTQVEMDRGYVIRVVKGYSNG